MLPWVDLISIASSSSSSEDKTSIGSCSINEIVF